MLGKGSKPSLPLRSSTIRAYATAAEPALKGCAARGALDLRGITARDVQDALDELKGGAARELHASLRSLFRTMRREKMIFRDPARKISVVVNRSLPKPLPDDRLAGLLSRTPDAGGRLVVALVAIHAPSIADQRGLALSDLERTRGRLLVRSGVRGDHTVFVDEITAPLVDAWLAERYHRWPRTTNPHLLVSDQSAAAATKAPVSTTPLTSVFRRLGLQSDRIRQDRIYDEAKEFHDPLRLIRIFGLSPTTAVNYVKAAHPARFRPGPIAP